MAKVEKKERVTRERGDGEERTADVGQVLRTLKNSFNKDRGELDKVAFDLTADENPTDVREFISTGSTLLDYVISNRRNGGIPVGKITEIQGEESSGKSLLAAHIAANVQRQGGFVVYIDTENAYNPDFAARVGVDNKRLLYLQPGTVEACFEAVEQCITTIRAKNSNALFLIIWDSIAATPPQAEIEGDYDPNSRIGLMAKAMAKGMRKLTNTIGKDRVALVFTNQLKMRPGVMYGDPWVTPGGKAVAYHSSVRIRLESSTKLKDPKTNQVFAIKTNARAVKTRLGPPHRKCTFQIQFATGVDDVNSWRDLLHELKHIEKRGGYMYMHDVPAEELMDPKTGEVLPPPVPVEAEIKFRENEWRRIIDERPRLRAHVLSLIDAGMVVKYSSAQPHDVGDDAEVEEFQSED